jgi:hypothetical protein
MAVCALPAGAAPPHSQHLATAAPACTAVSVATSPSSAAPVGATVTITAGASGCPSPLFEFWVLEPGQSWLVAQLFSTTSTYTWIQTSPSGIYRWSVWARNAGSTAAYEAFNAFDYTITTCSGVTASVLPAGSAPEGSMLTFTWTYQGCTYPAWYIWVLPPGGHWYYITCIYVDSRDDDRCAGQPVQVDTAGWPVGTYRFSIWLRSGPGLHGTYPYFYDTFSAFSYTLTQPSPCSGITVTATPASSATAGTWVTLMPNVTGCANPDVEFWLHAPGGTWTVVQPYRPAASGAFTWITQNGPLPTGTYRISVWARDRGRATAYDTFSAFDYTLTATTPCSSVTVTSSPPVTASAGTTVTMTAGATGCPNPEFEFWMLPPGGTWQIIGASYFKGSGNLTWNTAGMPAGSYRFSVWARDAGSPGTSGTPPYTYDAFSAFQYTLT